MTATGTTPSTEATTPKIAVSYLRVSTTRQMSAGADIDAEGNSIATQRQSNAAKATRMGASIQREFVEPGASAQTIDKRPVFKELLAYLAEHPEVDLVIIYLRSRAFRNLGDAVVTKRRLEAMGVKLVSAKEDFGEGIMADAMEAVTDIINEVQVRMSGEDIKAKMRHKAERGGTNGRAKIGYRNVRIEHEGRQVNSIALDPERASLVRQAFELYASGDYSLQRLYAAMGDLGLATRPTRQRPAQPLSVSQLHRMLRDPYYVGIVSYKGEPFPGRHEALVGQDLFDRVQKVMDNRSTNGQRDRVHYHYLKGLLFCDRCRRNGRTCRLIFTEASGRGGTYAYYLCRGRQDGLCDLPYLPVTKVEWAVADHYATLGLPKEFLGTIRDAVRATMQEEQASIRELHTSYRKQLTKLDKQEERLLDLATTDEMPRDKIHARLRKLQLERSKATTGLAETGDTLATGARLLEQYIELLDEPAALYAHTSDVARRDLNTASFESLWLDDDGVQHDQKVPAIQELHDAARAYRALDAETVTEPNGLIDAKRKGSVGFAAEDPALETEDYLLADLFREGSSRYSLVREGGFEPPRPFGHWHLKPARLPFRHSRKVSRAKVSRHASIPKPAPRPRQQAGIGVTVGSTPRADLC